MTNKELRMAIDRIAQIKIMKKEESTLREEIIAEFQRRGKTKINLGGPTKEDYVKINYVDRSEFLPSASSGPAHIVEKLEAVPNGTSIQLSYRVSSDDKNMVRGIDL